MSFLFRDLFRPMVLFFVRVSPAPVLALILLWLQPGLAAVPGPVLYGPITADSQGHPSRNSIYSSSAIDLDEYNYIEEEYWMEGLASRYAVPAGPDTAEVIDSDHPYRTRLVVRRPINPADFRGVVIMEWLNVTGGADKDIDWWQSGRHFMRNGYAYVAVSAQQPGIDTMRTWSPERYGSLDTSVDGTVENDDLSFDIFTAAGKVIGRAGEPLSTGGIDVLAGLRARQLIATGHSQSATRLATYINGMHPPDPVYDGFMVHGGGGRVRDDQPVKIFKVLAETDVPRRAANPQPDTDSFRQWEVAGSSHVDVAFEFEWARVRLQRQGLPIADAALGQHQECRLPTLSRVPFRDVLNAAYDHLVIWVRDGRPPPVAERLQLTRALPQVELARDPYGNALGGIRLAEHAVATATNTGVNSGSIFFCYLYGSHQPFDRATLEQLYPSHAAYVQAVRQVVNDNLQAGYILPFAAERTIRQAEASSIGR